MPYKVLRIILEIPIDREYVYFRARNIARIQTRRWTRWCVAFQPFASNPYFGPGLDLAVTVSMKPPTVASNPGFPSWFLSRSSESPSCKTKSGTESLGLRLHVQLKTSCQNRYTRQVLEGLMGFFQVASMLLLSPSRLMLQLKLPEELVVNPQVSSLHQWW